MLFIYLVFAVFVGVPYVSQVAADEDLLYTEAYNGYEYYIYGRATWFMASETCSMNGMSLVRIDDQNKNDEVTYFVDKLSAISGPYWTLASRMYDETTWSFGMGDPLKYFNWEAGEPNNAGGNEKCIELYKSGTWNDKDCSAERYVLCEKKP